MCLSFSATIRIQIFTREYVRENLKSLVCMGFFYIKKWTMVVRVGLESEIKNFIIHKYRTALCYVDSSWIKS